MSMGRGSRGGGARYEEDDDGSLFGDGDGDDGGLTSSVDPEGALERQVRGENARSMVFFASWPAAG